MTATDPADPIREALISVIWYADQVIAEEAAAATSPGMLRRPALGSIAVAALDLVRAVDAAPEHERPDGWRTDGHPLGDGHQVHVYHSTACLHGQHAHCGSRFNAYTGTEKKPAECKFCDATCICACHHKEES